MKEIIADKALVAYCGLYCGACRGYLKGRCPGCHENVKATWCKLRSCCIDNEFHSCAQCREFPDPNNCKKFNNLISRFFAIIFRSNRAACIEQIKTAGLEGHALKMTAGRRHSLPR